MKYNKLTLAIALIVFGLVVAIAWRMLQPEGNTEPEPQSSENAAQPSEPVEEEEAPPSAFPEWGSYDPSAQPTEEKVPTIQKMLNDPKVREAFLAQLQTQVGLLYEDLFKMLGLNADEQEQLKALLAERASAGIDLGFAMMSGEKLSPEAMDQKKQELTAAKEESDKSIKKLLGDESAQKFEKYEKSLPERQQVKSMREQFKQKGISFSEEKATQLTEIMTEQRNNFPFTHDFRDENNLNPAIVTRENVAKFIEQNGQLREQTLSEASQRLKLSDQEMEVFRNTLEQRAQIEKMAFEMMPIVNAGS